MCVAGVGRWGKATHVAAFDTLAFGVLRELSDTASFPLASVGAISARL